MNTPTQRFEKTKGSQSDSVQVVRSHYCLLFMSCADAFQCQPRMRLNHGLLIRGYSSNSHNLILKWYPPNSTAVNGVYENPGLTLFHFNLNSLNIEIQPGINLDQSNFYSTRGPPRQNRRLYVMNHLDHHWLRRHWLQQGVVKKAGGFFGYSARRKSTTHCGSTVVLHMGYSICEQHGTFEIFWRSLGFSLLWNDSIQSLSIYFWSVFWDGRLEKKLEILHLHQGKSHYQDCGFGAFCALRSSACAWCVGTSTGQRLWLQ